MQSFVFVIIVLIGLTLNKKMKLMNAAHKSNQRLCALNKNKSNSRAITNNKNWRMLSIVILNVK